MIWVELDKLGVCRVQCSAGCCWWRRDCQMQCRSQFCCCSVFCVLLLCSVAVTDSVAVLIWSAALFWYCLNARLANRLLKFCYRLLVHALCSRGNGGEMDRALTLFDWFEGGGLDTVPGSYMGVYIYVSGALSTSQSGWEKVYLQIKLCYDKFINMAD